MACVVSPNGIVHEAATLPVNVDVSLLRPLADTDPLHRTATADKTLMGATKIPA